MEREAYERMAINEKVHWWFVGRRAVIRSLLSRYVPSRSGPLRVLEAGCGSGGNLAMLAEWGNVDAFEFDAPARQVALEVGHATITRGELPCGIVQPDGAYDLVALLDVLEHIDDDVEALFVLGKKLNAGGRLLITVPAHPWLWSEHDRLHHHKRRYSRASFERVVSASGLTLVKMGYFNALLFPLALLDRLLARCMPDRKSGDHLPNPVLNALLKKTFSLERLFVGTRLAAPTGLSMYAIVCKT